MKRAYLPVRQGFTLLEVIVAMAVFVTGMLAIVTLASNSNLVSKTSAVKTKAALLAQEGIETAVAEGYLALEEGELFMDEADLSYIGSSFSPYSRTVQIEYVDSDMNVVGSDLGMKLITSTVAWDDTAPDPNNLEKSYSIKTVISDL